MYLTYRLADRKVSILIMLPYNISDKIGSQANSNICVHHMSLSYLPCLETDSKFLRSHQWRRRKSFKRVATLVRCYQRRVSRACGV